MENKKTAVEWLEENLIGNPHFESYFIHNRNTFKQAKAMEKEQIIDAMIRGFSSSAEGWNGEIPCMKWSEMVREIKCEEYYQETYGIGH
jgi:hypothetical protein